MDRFVPHTDNLGQLLQAKAEQLFTLMKNIDVERLGLSEHGNIYFLGSHFKRMFFSIQTSAHLLYNSIQLSKKDVKDIVIMDYGAGIGSLYILAKMIGCKQVIYNDILEEWKQNALLIANAIHIDVDDYIVGNIDDTLKILEQKGVKCDIITSRNVVEHIYRLADFYKIIAQYQPQAIVYSSTTASFNNPATNIQHVLHHRKIEKIYVAQRIKFIEEHFPKLTDNTIKLLAKKTRGYEKNDLLYAVNQFNKDGSIPAKGYYYTNTCYMEYGVWAENLLPFLIHKQMAQSAGMGLMIKPGFWDTHYTKPWKNKMGSFFNAFISVNPSIGFLVAPFIYIIALPNKEKKQS
ncbi:hypothetical protein [Parasediminibacterium sp. JCM 36343]|uniref:hypothetical protein n=1 Tax=Parasediminibacterium sp. JCM 36343 TaxID=3374279 RepID=UPI00397AFBBC